MIFIITNNNIDVWVIP